MEEQNVNSWENLIPDIEIEGLVTIMMSCVERWS